MARKSYEVAGLCFRTKGELIEHIRRIMYGVAFETPLEGRDLAFMADLLTRHSSAEQKIGPGVEAIVTRPNPVFPNNRGFWVKRTDGTETDFSFLECISPSNQRSKVLYAARREVVSQVIGFRTEWFVRAGGTAGRIVCPLTGASIGVNESHVDHVPPDTFLALWERFMEAGGFGYDDVRLTPNSDGDIGDAMADFILASAWSDFHREYARLRVVSVLGNLSLSKRESFRATEV